MRPPAIAGLVTVLSGMWSAATLGAAAPAISVSIVSSRAEAVSGSDVLVQLIAPAGGHWSATLNGREVTSEFRPDEKSGRLLALLNGLIPGHNALEFGAADVLERLDILDHPLGGPIFSGVHQAPFVCQTEASGLGAPLDVDCNAPTKVEYYYKSTGKAEIDFSSPSPNAGSWAPGFKPYDSRSVRPSEVAQIVTTDGHSVPYIVRREIGTINRAVYDIQFLHRPGQPLPTPWTHSTPGWNGRLVYLVDGGCGAGYRQGTFTGAIGAANQPFLSEGYATATSTLNIAGNNCNDRISAETLSMVKEHFIKEYGVPAHTMAWGDSSGAIMQQLTAQNYPGLLDGIIPYLSFPDEASTLQTVADCVLLERAFETSKRLWTPEQKTAVSGFATWRTCIDGWSDGNGRIWPILTPQRTCPVSMSKRDIYDPATNSQGARCDLYNNEINVFGRDPRTNRAYRPLDNVGVQYGLQAFNKRQIDADQFIDINARIGGLDDDGNIVAARSQAEVEALRNAYRLGLVLTGGGGLGDVPIIDWRPYADDLANQHDSFRSFVTRARLIAARGRADNHVILVYPRYSLMEWSRFVATRRYEVIFPDQPRDLVRLMDRWLDSISADRADGTLSAKVARNRPAELADSCWTTAGERVTGPTAYRGSNRCDQLYPAHGDPRLAAGGPLADDVLKCTLKPLSAGDYSTPLTADQKGRLEAAFPNGVCDYTRPGIAQEVTTTVWQKF